MTTSPDSEPDIPGDVPPPSPPPGSDRTAAARRLARSQSDRMISGVAGGLGEHFGVDASLVRIAIVVLTIVSGGVASLLYVGAWLVLPEGPAVAPAAGDADDPDRPRHWRGRRSGTSGLVWGVLLIAAGALLLARQADVRLPPPEAIVAGALILVGLLLLVQSRRGLNSGLLLAVLLSGVLAVASEANVGYDGAFSERVVAVGRAEDLDDSYGQAFGQLSLDLRGMAFPEGTTEVTVSVAFGSAEIFVPRDVSVQIEATTLSGSSQVRGQEVGGFGVDTTRSDTGYANASKRLLIHVTTLLGSTEVR